jgi:hypothetical protein
MLLSELLNQERNDTLAYGVEVDCECLAPPPSIERIGLLYQPGPAGLSESLMDAIISFSLAGVEVIVEIPHEADLDHAYLLKLASNAGFSIAAIPPDVEKDVGAWGQQCAKFVRPFLTTPNFSQHIYPIAGYFSYLIAEKLGGVDAAQPNDPYVLSRFTQSTPEAWSDQAKIVMRSAFSEVCDGEDGIKELALSLTSAIRIESSKIIQGDGQTAPNI